FELRDNILSFIEANYADSSLTLEGIAMHFSMSPSYITRFFKDHMGLSLIRYLDQLRMEQLKELLRTTELPISELGALVGYVDVSNMIRKFKKAEGITPAQYRLMTSQLKSSPASVSGEKTNA